MTTITLPGDLHTSLPRFKASSEKVTKGCMVIGIVPEKEHNGKRIR